MIDPILYSTIYNIVIVILTIITTSFYSGKENRLLSISKNKSDLFGFIIALTFALFIGFRPMSNVFVDMVNYNNVYYAFAFQQPFRFDIEAENFIFDNLFAWLGTNGYDITVLFVIISLIYFLVTYCALSRMFPSHALYAFVVFLGAFSTYSYSTNGIKAGAATAFFLYAIAMKKHKIKATIFLLASLGFHHSMIMPIGAYLICYFVKNTKLYYGIWLFALLMSLAHITYFQEIFGGMADNSGSNYLNNIDGDWGGKKGFRYDFVIYSFFPIAVGYYVLFKYKLKSEGFTFIYNIYLLTNAIWMLCMHAAFTNRIAYLSWFLYPVVLVYPFLTKKFMPNQFSVMNKLVWIQLLFSLSMDILYYG